MSKVTNKRDLKQTNAESAKLKKLEKRSTRANSTTALSASNSGEVVNKQQIKKLFEKQEKAKQEEEQQKVSEKLNKNMHDSDDSSDEEVLLRTGNVPAKWYELYDH